MSEDNLSISPLHDPAATAAAAIAQLQQSSQIYDDGLQMFPSAVTPESTGDADSGVETKSIDIKSEPDQSMMDADSGDEIPPNEPAPNARILDVRCGNLTGRLYEERFTCPGIHKKCIEFDGKLISPRQFTIRAEKDKQKDWKGSIRVGRYNLRSLMEMKKIDFYEHETNCSLKCQSRNYIKNRKQAALENSFSFLDNLVKNGATMSTPTNDLTTDQPSSSSTFTTNDFNSSSVSSNDENGFNNNGTRKGSSALEEYVSRMSNSTNTSAAALAKIGPIKNEFTNDTIDYQQQKSTTILPQSSTPQTQSQQLPTNIPNLSNSVDFGNFQHLWKNLNGPIQNNGLHNFAGIVKNENDHVAAILTNLMEQQKGIIPTHFPGIQQSNFVNPTTNDEFMKTGDALTGVNVKKIMEQQPVMFWERMREMNLVDDLTTHMSQVLEQLKTVYRTKDARTDAFAAERLSNVALSLSLTDDFARKIQAAFVQSALQKEIQRKAAEERRKLEAKRKNEVLDQLMKVSQQMDPQQLQLIQQILQQQQVQQSPDLKKIRLNI